MPTPRFEDANGVVDGVNTSFTTNLAYEPGSLEVFINGQLKRTQDEDGWTETGPQSFELKEAPIIISGEPEKVRVFYRGADSPGTIAENLVGVISEVEELTGTLQPVQELVGVLEEVETLTGVIVEVDELQGTIEEVDELIGVICECP